MCSAQWLTCDSEHHIVVSRFHLPLRATSQSRTATFTTVRALGHLPYERGPTLPLNPRPSMMVTMQRLWAWPVLLLVLFKSSSHALSVEYCSSQNTGSSFNQGMSPVELMVNPALCANLNLLQYRTYISPTVLAMTPASTSTLLRYCRVPIAGVQTMYLQVYRRQILATNLAPAILQTNAVLPQPGSSHT